MCQCNSDLFNNSPLISFSFFLSFTLSASLISNRLSNFLFSLYFSSLFSYVIYHCLLLVLSPPCSLSLPSSFHRYPQPPPSVISHVPMEQNTLLIALLLIYNRTERTGQSLKGLVNFRLRQGKKRRVGEREESRCNLSTQDRNVKM